MANSGSNSNGSQFFITLASARHLDNKHAIFGKVVGGNLTLDKIEDVGSGKDERPLQEITLMKAAVFDSPYTEIDSVLLDQIKIRMKERIDNEITLRTKPAAQVENAKAVLRQADSSSKSSTTAPASGVGKYLSSAVVTNEKDLDAFLSSNAPEEAQRKKQKTRAAFSDFSGW